MAISGNGWDVLSAREAVGPVGGLNARDQRSSAWQQGVKRHDIVSTRRKLPINVRSSIGLYRGPSDGCPVDYDSIRNAPRTGKNARKRAARAA